jgi:alditol oxidase
VARTPTTNWAGNVTFRAARVHRPTSLDELRRTVHGCRHVRALGTGHSFSDIGDTTGDVVLLDGLPPAVEIDPARATVSVGAGTRYAELAVTLHRAGFALANLASLPHISVAGSCATGTHGSGDTQRCLAAGVAALDLVGPDGDLTTLRRGVDRDFAGAVVALGAVGVAARLTLDIEPAYEVAQTVYVEVPLDEIVARLDDVLGAAYSVSVFTDWRGEASVWLKRRTDRPVGVWTGAQPARHPVHPVPGLPPASCTEQLGIPGPWYERLPHFRVDHRPSAGDELQSEFYLPRDRARAALSAVRAIAERVAPVLHISEVRTVRADDLWLSPAYGRDSVTIHFTWVRDAEAVRPVLAAVEERLMPLGARPHWGKLSTVDAVDIVAGYERAADFAELAERYDPGRTFRNAFVDALFPGR